MAVVDYVCDNCLKDKTLSPCVVPHSSIKPIRCPLADGLRARWIEKKAEVKDEKARPKK